jgi:hypothetical protein
MAFPATTEASCCAYLPVVYLGTDATTTLVARVRWEGIGVVGKLFTCNLSSSRAVPAGNTIVRPRRATSGDDSRIVLGAGVHECSHACFHARPRGLCSVRARPRHRIK